MFVPRLRRCGPARTASLAALLLATVALPARAQTTITVSTASDAISPASGDCTLREAIESANTDAALDACAAGSGADTIVFDAALSGQTITLGGTQLSITSSLSIDASALAGGITVSGNDASRVFQVNGGTVTMQALTITGGNQSRGGGLLVSGGSATLERVTVHGNDGGDYGGGLQVNTDASLTLRNVTVANNTTTNGGAGVWVFGGTLTAVNTTIAGNSNHGVFVDWAVNDTDPSVTLTNVILANNGSDDWRNPSNGTVTITRTLAEQRYGGGNFQGLTTDPVLGPLADNGGPVQTMAIRAVTSPALDAGDAAACLATDARGTARYDLPDVANNGASSCDLGAYEHGATAHFAVGIAAITDQTGTTDTPLVVNFTVSGDGTLTLSAESSNPAVLPVANIAFGGAGSARTATLTPAGPGTSTVTITVGDGTSTVTSSFSVTFTVPDLPLGFEFFTNFETGSSQHYFPTTTGKYSIISTQYAIDPDTYGDGIFYLDLEILATGYWPGQEGFIYGVAGYPLSDPNFHELGARNDEWGYRGRDGLTAAEGRVAAFGDTFRNVGDRIRLWYDSRTDELSFYTMRVGEEAWSLEGGRVAFTGVVPEDGRALHFAVSGICWQPCGVRMTANGVPPAAANSTVTMTSGTSYAFSASDFNFDDQGDYGGLSAVRIVTLPATGTLFLDLNDNATPDAGEAVAAGAGVTKSNLDLGRLRFASAVPSTASFTFQVYDAIGPSAAAYTMTVNPSVVATSEVGGDAGWRLMAVPATQTTVGTLARQNLVQGITGSYPQVPTQVNLLTGYDGTDWTTPADTTDLILPGQGFAWYLFNQNLAPGDVSESHTLPFTLRASTTAPVTDQTVTLHADGDRWNLLGNPFAGPLDVAAMGAWAGGEHLASAVGQVWEDAPGAHTGGSYVPTTLLGGTVAPFTGFFVQSQSAGALTFPAAALAPAAPVAATAASDTAAATPSALVAFELHGTTRTGAATLDRACVLYLSDEAGAGWDRLDAAKLEPLASQYAVVGVSGTDAEGRPVLKAQESRPLQGPAPEASPDLEIPLAIEAVGMQPRMRLMWPRLDRVPEAWGLVLEDRELGRTQDLRTTLEYVFDVVTEAPAESGEASSAASGEPAEAAALDPRAPRTLRPNDLSRTNGAEEAPRFVLRVARNRTNTAAEPGSAAAKLTLLPNYPNPFRATTTLSFTVPTDGRAALTVYDVLGREVASLFDGMAEAGRRYRVTLAAEALGTGVYVSELRHGGRRVTRSLLLAR